MDEAFDYLDAPVKRLSAADAPMPYSSPLEQAAIPSKERIVEAVALYNAKLVMDSTGVGEPIFDDFRRAGLDVTGYHFTEESKRRVVENLNVEMEAERVTIAD